MICVSTLAMDKFHTCFYDAADSNPEAFSPFGRMEKCAQLMLLVAVLLRAVRTWKLDVLFEFHVADSCDDGVDFSPYFYGFSASPNHPEVLWIYTLAHMSLNNHNTHNNHNKHNNHHNHHNHNHHHNHHTRLNQLPFPALLVTTVAACNVSLQRPGNFTHFLREGRPRILIRRSIPTGWFCRLRCTRAVFPSAVPFVFPLLDKSSRPALCNDRCRFWFGRKPVAIPQEQFLDKVWLRGCGGGPQLQFIFKVVNILVMTQR